MGLLPHIILFRPPATIKLQPLEYIEKNATFTIILISIIVSKTVEKY